jgi:hypothetical protein
MSARVQQTSFSFIGKVLIMFKTPLITKRSFLSLLLLGSAGLAQAQSLQEVVSQHVQALGGADKLRSLQSLQLEAETKVMLFMTIKVRTVMLNNEGVRLTIYMGNDEVSRSVATPQGGASFEDGKRKAMDPREASGLFESADLSGPFVDSEKKGITLKLLGQQPLQRGGQAYVIEVQRPGGRPASRHFIRTDNFMVARIEEQTYSTEDRKWKEEWDEFDDYREVQGVKMAHRIRSDDGEFKVTSYRVNESLDKRMFALQ